MHAKFPRLFGMFLLVLILLGGTWTWLTLHWSYSEGERAGYVQKLSKKGWLCKTWEGEIAMVTMPGAIPEKFYFTVRDEEMAHRINAMAGQRVTMLYQQHKFIPSSCFGDTEYFVRDVKVIQDDAAAQAATAVQQGTLQGPR